MKELTKETLDKINKFYKSYIGCEDEIEFDESANLYGCYAFMFSRNVNEDLSTKENEWVISFNEEVPTSVLLNISSFIIPTLTEELDATVMVAPCHMPIYDKDEKFLKLLYEDHYEKQVVAKKKSKK